MEVDKVSFYPLLLDILTEISEAHFVAFDLELSGVPTKKTRSEGGTGRPTLQERYLETKEAAERYQILQIGLTCVQQDVESSKYILKPYNFNLSPLIDEHGLDIERIFSFQSGAAEFLHKVGFDIGRPFHRGVPYLSRAEAREAREKHAKRQDKTTISDIQIKPTETESLAFLERVRGEITAWLASRSLETLDFLNIDSVGTDAVNDNSEPPQDLSRFEKRLVHQLVRAEFPELVTISKRGFIQVVRFDQQREDRLAADRKKDLEERLNRQKGFRWIIEALHGSDLNNLDLRECAKDPISGDHIFADMDQSNAQFNRAQALLRGNPQTLVGHNCFLDLVYIYRTFFGNLPHTVEEFQRKIHKLWPVIVDTKYMSTHNCGDINPVSSLEQIAQQLDTQQKPIIKVDKLHNKYKGVETNHEAGYDSFLTAQVAVRLSSKLEKEGAYLETTGTMNGNDNNITKAVTKMKLTETTLESHTYHSQNGTCPPSEPDGFMPSIEGARWKRKGDPTLPVLSSDNPFEYNPKDLKHRHHGGEAEKTVDGGMPRFGSDFWRVYGNKLRVFGTEEGMCVLDGSDASALEDDDGDFGVAQGGVEV